MILILSQGIYYLLTHPFLWPLLKTRFILCETLSIFVLLFLFIFTYLPQVALLAIFQGGLAWVNAVFLVLGEGSAIIALLFEAFFVDETLAEIVDSVGYSLAFFLLVYSNNFIIMNRSLSTKATRT